VEGKHRFSTESLQQIHGALAAQVDALNARIEAMRRELKEAQKLRDELSPDLDYLKRRLAGENADALLEQRRNALTKNGNARKTASAIKPAKADAKPTAKRAKKPRASASRERS